MEFPFVSRKKELPTTIPAGLTIAGAVGSTGNVRVIGTSIRCVAGVGGGYRIYLRALVVLVPVKDAECMNRSERVDVLVAVVGGCVYISWHAINKTTALMTVKQLVGDLTSWRAELPAPIGV